MCANVDRMTRTSGERRRPRVCSPHARLPLLYRARWRGPTKVGLRFFASSRSLRGVADRWSRISIAPFCLLLAAFYSSFSPFSPIFPYLVTAQKGLWRCVSSFLSLFFFLPFLRKKLSSNVVTRTRGERDGWKIVRGVHVSVGEIWKFEVFQRRVGGEGGRWNIWRKIALRRVFDANGLGWTEGNGLEQERFVLNCQFVIRISTYETILRLFFFPPGQMELLRCFFSFLNGSWALFSLFFTIFFFTISRLIGNFLGNRKIPLTLNNE